MTRKDFLTFLAEPPVALFSDLLEGLCLLLLLVEERLEDDIEPEGEAVELARSRQRDELSITDRTGLVQLDPSQIKFGDCRWLGQQIAVRHAHHLRLATWR